MIRQAAEQAGTDRIENMLQVGFFSRRTTEQLGLEGAAQELEEPRRADARDGHGRRADPADAGADPQADGDHAAYRPQLHRARAPAAEPQLHGEVPSRDADGEELLPPDRGRDRAHARGRHPARAADQEHPLDPQEAAQARQARSPSDPAAQHGARRNPVRGHLQDSSQGPPEARDPVRRVVVGRERVALHAAVHVQRCRRRSRRSAATSSWPSSAR